MRKRAILAALFLGVTALAARAVVRVDVKTLDRDRVLAAAAEYLAEKPVTLTAFPTARNPGGPHDYFSDSDYFWPDPKNPEGPYVQRDGQSNPANFTAHRHALIRMSLWVPALTSAWKLTGEEKFSAQAVAHLRAWFVDEATRMNPNLQYSQAVRNKYTGRCYGIIDTLHLVEVARSIELLREGQQLAPRDDAGLRQWFTAYVQWLRESEFGKKEGAGGNNHETCYWLQVGMFARMLGDQALVAEARQHFKEKLLPMMDANGGFPRELKRTKPYGYSLFQLDQIVMVAKVLSTPEDNLFAYTTPDGRNLRQALAFMYPFVQDKAQWLARPGTQPDVMYWENWPVRSCAWLYGGEAYGEQKYLELWQRLNANPKVMEVLRNLPIRQPVLWE